MYSLAPNTNQSWTSLNADSESRENHVYRHYDLVYLKPNYTVVNQIVITVWVKNDHNFFQ